MQLSYLYPLNFKYAGFLGEYLLGQIEVTFYSGHPLHRHAQGLLCNRIPINTRHQPLPGHVICGSWGHWAKCWGLGMAEASTGWGQGADMCLTLDFTKRWHLGICQLEGECGAITSFARSGQ